MVLLLLLLLQSCGDLFVGLYGTVAQLQFENLQASLLCRCCAAHDLNAARVLKRAFCVNELSDGR